MQGYRFVIVITSLLLLTGCVGRQTLTGEHFQLRAPGLERALAEVETRAAVVDSELYLGFEAGNDKLWFPLLYRDHIEQEGVAIHLAELDTSSRRYRAPREEDHITVLDEETFSEMMAAVLRWMTPLGPDEGLALQMRNRDLVSWRDENGLQHLASWEQLPSGVQVRERINDRQLAARMLPLLEHYVEQQQDQEAPRHLLFTLDRDAPGGLAWIHADLEERSLHYIASPFTGAEITEPRLRVSMKTLNRVVIRSHFITFLRNPVTTVRRLLGQGEDMIASLVRRGPERIDPDAPLNEGPGMDLDAWEAQLDQITGSRNYPGEVEFLVGGEAFFSDLVERIHRAEKHIDIRTFIFDRDEFAVRIADLLRARSEEVPVRVMMDDMGSLLATLSPPPGGHRHGFQPPADIARYLARDSQVRVRRVGNPWLTGDHVKLTLVDDAAWVGGMNYGKEYRYYWTDLMARVEGPVVRRLQQEFDKAWAHAGPAGDLGYLVQALRLPRLTAAELEAAENMVPLRPLRTRSGRREILQAQLAAIRNTRDYIYISAPYFTEPDITNALITARARGVDVRVILPGAGNHNIMNSANLFTANRLLEAGVRVHVYPGMTHMKAAVYDGWASFGSANFDRLSFKVNQELNLATSHEETVRDLEARVFEPKFEQSRELTEPIAWTWVDTLARVLATPI